MTVAHRGLKARLISWQQLVPTIQLHRRHEAVEGVGYVLDVIDPCREIAAQAAIKP